MENLFLTTVIENIMRDKDYKNMKEFAEDNDLDIKQIYNLRTPGVKGEALSRALQNKFPEYFYENIVNRQSNNFVNEDNTHYVSKNDPYHTGLKSLQTSINHLRQPGITFKEKISTLGGMKIIIDQIIYDL